MKVKRVLILITVVLAVALLGACVRSASTPPAREVLPPAGETEQAASGDSANETSAESAVKAPEGQPTNEVLQQLALFVTQTAAAAQIASGQQPGEAGQAVTPYPSAETGQAGAPYPTVESGQAGSTSPSGEAGQAGSTGSSGESGQAGTPGSGTTGGQTQPGEAAQATQPDSGGQTGGEQTGGQQPATQQPTEAAQSTPPAASNVVITATPGIPKTYTLQSGEFPYCIARRFNVNPFELLSINGLTTGTVVHGGTTLKIPQTGNLFPGERALKAHPTVYVVQGGENIYEIACSFGDVSPDMIALANSLKSPFTLTAGKSLNIP
jgi:LysM repeat protein